jgi:hypothetical protein
MEWQPIETAPKDGTRILICGGNLRLVEIAYWWDHTTMDHGKITCRIEKWCMSGGLGNPEPKLWMSIPAPPQ